MGLFSVTRFLVYSRIVALGRPVLHDISTSMYINPLLQPVRGWLLLLVELRDLCALQRQVIHQPFSAEDKSNHRILDVAGVDLLARAKID